MRVSLGRVILKKRKEKKITQQQLADFVGVSKTSVSKWENEQTYPDITFLPLLAAYFDISIDSLLDYEPQLNKEEIQHIYLSLQNSFQERNDEEVWKSINSFIQRYYSCYPFIFQMGMLILNHYDLLPSENSLEEANVYINEALTLFVRIRSNSHDIDLVNESIKMEAYCLLILNRSDEVLDALGEYVPARIPPDDLIAGAFQLKGEQKRAIATSQSGIYQNLFVLISSMTNYLQFILNDLDRFNQSYQRESLLIEIFNIEKVNPAISLNFYLSAAADYAQLGEKNALLDVLTKAYEILEVIDFPLAFHTDNYFDLIQDWLDNQALGGQTPKESKQTVESIFDFLLNSPLLEPYKENTQIKEMIDQINQLRERRNNNGSKRNVSR